jgi:hypothetical protein
MKKKIVFFTAVTAALAIGITSLVSADLIPTSLLPSKNGEYGVQEGVTYKRPGISEKRGLINSIDPVTNKAAKDLTNEVVGLTEKRIKMDLDSNDITLTFNTVARNGKSILIPPASHKPGTQYSIFHHPKLELIEFNGSIYTVDIDKQRFGKILNDTHGDLTIEKAKEISNTPRNDGEDPFIWWGSRPNVNPDATKMVFFSNRGDKEQLWLKDLETGAEKPLELKQLSSKGWINNNEFIASDFGETVKYNVLTGEKTKIADDVIALAVDSSTVILQKEVGNLLFVNFETKEEKEYRYDGLNLVNHIAVLDGNNHIAFINQPDRNKGLYELFVVNKQDLSTKNLRYTEGETLYPRWIDTDNLLLNIHNTITQEDKSVFINVKDL